MSIIGVIGIVQLAPNTLFTQQAHALTATSEIYFTFDTATGTITDYDSTNGPKDVVIPSTISGVTVTTIGNGAFNNKQLNSVVIPDTVTVIGSGSFSTNNLTSVVIPDSVVTIAAVAFSQNDISSLSIGKAIQSIGPSAFQYNDLASITLPNSLQTIGDAAFNNNQLTSVAIPNSVVSIGAGAFTSNPLVSVTIGTSDFTGTAQLTISSGVFSLSDLTSLTLGKSVEAISTAAFYLSKLTSITIPSSVKTIGAGAFASSLITTVTIEGDTTIAPQAFDSVPSKTGSYIQLYTTDPANPYGYQDVAGTYIVNPSQLHAQYVTNAGTVLQPPSGVKTGDTLEDYSVASNPTADFSLYYRSGDTRTLSAPQFSGYQHVDAQVITLHPGNNTATFTYYPPVIPGVPNTGVRASSSVDPLAISGVAGVLVASLAVGCILRRKLL